MAASMPPMLRYDLVNVFVADRRPYSGNPLAVIYDGQDLTTEQCAALGRQFNLSEITFPFDVDPQKSEYKNRIFTPATELDFAGHPTLGTSFALLQQKQLKAEAGTATQISGRGSIVTSVTFPKTLGSPYEPARIAMRGLKQFVTGRLPVLPREITAMLGFAPEEAESIQSKVRFVRRASCGLPWLYIGMDSIDSVKALNVELAPLLQWCDLLKDSIDEDDKQDRWLNGISTFAVERDPSGDLKVYARVMLEENGSIMEDPATGSAALGLGLVLHEEGLLEHGKSYAITQGIEVSMPSQLFGSVELDPNGKTAAAVHVAGDVVKLGSGEFRVPDV